MKIVKRAPWIMLCSMAMLLVACGTGVDSDLFNESACKAPCWHQLTPGESTTGDVEHFLDTLGNRFWWPDRNVHKSGSEIQWIRVTDRTGSKIVDFYMENGKLNLIRSSRSTSATLGQVVEHFGAPEYVRAELAVGPDGHVYILEVYYPKRGLSFEISPVGMEISPSQPDVGQINAYMPVKAIQYYPPGNLRSYLLVRHPASFQENIEQDVQAWPGFGRIKVIETR